MTTYSQVADAYAELAIARSAVNDAHAAWIASGKDYQAALVAYLAVYGPWIAAQ